MASHCKRIKTFLFVMICVLVMLTSSALADVGGYAQTGVDRFDHAFESRLTGDASKDIVQIALAQRGKTGSQLGYFGGDWCAAFVVDCAKYASVSNLIPFVSGHTHACGGAGSYWYLYEYMVNAGAAIVNTASARTGDIVFFGYTSNSYYSHVGIMVDNVNTIEGNCDGSTYLTRSVQGKSINGRAFDRITILRPKYPEPKNTLDLNGFLDGTNSGSLGSHGTCDVYINGSLVANDVNDYCAAHALGTTYTIQDIKANTGYEYIGLNAGSLTGTISSAGLTDVRLSFSRQGNLLVQGSLDGVFDLSTADYGTFDVYINGSLDASNCTTYNKQWPNGTLYEIRNVQPQTYKNFSSAASSGLSGTISSGNESTAILALSTDGVATTEWQTGKVLPGNLDPSLLDVQYQHTYVEHARTSPGSDWNLIETGAVQYEPDGSQYNSDDPLPTSQLTRLVGHYYFHWCGDPNDVHHANYFRREGLLDTYHTIPLDQVQYFSVRTTAQDGDRTYYSFSNVGDNTLATCPDGCKYYYEGNVYQNYKAYQINTYQKITEWTDTFDSSADSYTVRWRLKDGVLPEEPDEYSFTVDGWIDGTRSSSVTDYGFFDLYIDGELYAADITGFSGTFAWNAHYDIQNIRTIAGKKYNGPYYGQLSGDFGYGRATVTLSFSTILDIGEDWTEVNTLSQDLYLSGCDVEYKNHYLYSDRTSPGDEWMLYEVGPTQYENDGSTYESDNALPTSETRVLVGNYYFHWCNNGSNANYYQKDYLPYKHTIPNDQLQYFSVEEKGTDGDGSGRKYYYLKNLTGEWAGSYAQCSSTGSPVYYQGYVYQNKKAYTINTYVRESDWTATPDPNATFVTYRIRLKEYTLTFDANGGTFEMEATTKYHDLPLTLPADIPVRSGYLFSGWTLEQDGSGKVYQPGFWFIENGDQTLYAQWAPMSSIMLPSGIKVISSEAFMNCGAMVVYIPSGCTTIEANAFSNNDQLQEIHIPSSVTSIDFEAFTGCSQLTIYAPDGSRAARFAQNFGIPFVAE